MFNTSKKGGSSYFTQTSVRDWDPLDYHTFWKSTSVKLDKATVTRAFNEQVEWLIENGVESEQEKAKYLKKQFQVRDNGCRDPVGHRGTRGTMSPTRYSCTIRNDNVANTYSKDTSSEKVKEESQKNGNLACKDNLKRKRDDDESDYEGLSLLFDESNEDVLVESIDEKVLEKENMLPQAISNSVSKLGIYIRQAHYINPKLGQPKNMDAGIIEAFHKYQKTLPKTRKIFTPAYWGVLDLTGESLYDCKQLTEEDITQISQDFANKISWKTVPPEENIQEYFDSNCEKKFDGGLGPLGIPTACRKKRYLDKVKLMTTMRDGINKLLKECKYIPLEKRLELNFYAMDWSGADEDEFGMLEDAYCILKLLEKKSLEVEKLVKQLFLENTKGKRRQIASETEAELNENRSPER
ncbi:12291_t:CDS:2 [Acaulospora colombiana]|uniref:12291_t:CDS:1 n=1 Tax=Acaulospora colombiana TaxID=27376 RepID=A0ACA9L9P3_9GLOM|nr:12291_t:CDS:2 [Acaulospora colombiana]